MKNTVFAALVAALLPLSAEAGIDAAMAAKLVGQCEADAQKQKIALSIVVLDAGGHVVLAKRMDGARPKTIEVAEGKAQAALSIGAPSALLQQAIDSGKTSYMAVPGIIPIQGGLPVLRDGVVIGAMGASGAAEHVDEACVKSALATVK